MQSEADSHGPQGPMAAPEFLGAAGDLLARAIDQRSASTDGRMGLQRLTMKNLVIQLASWTTLCSTNIAILKLGHRNS